MQEIWCLLLSSSIKKYTFKEDAFNSFQSTDRWPFLSGKAARIYKFTIMVLIKLSEVILAVVLVTKSCLTLLRRYGLQVPCPPVFSVHGIFHAKVLEWVAMLLSSRSSQPQDQTHVSRFAGRFFTIEPPGKPLSELLSSKIDHSSVFSMLRVLVLSPEELTRVISNPAICLQVVYKMVWNGRNHYYYYIFITDNYDIDFCSWI